MNPKFGTLLRALRLGWYYWQEEGVFVRITPVDLTRMPKEIHSRITWIAYVEVTREFAGLSTTLDKEIHYVIDSDTAKKLFNLCEPLRNGLYKGEELSYLWYVNNNGEAVSV